MKEKNKENKKMEGINKVVKKAEENIAEVLEEDTLDAVFGGITPILPPKP